MKIPDSIYNVAYYYKSAVAIALGMAIWLTETKAIGEPTLEAKAAMHASTAAATLFVGMIPTKRNSAWGQFANITTRIVGATATLLAATYLLHSTTNGQIWGTFVVAFYPVLLIGSSAGIGSIYAILTELDKGRNQQ